MIWMVMLTFDDKNITINRARAPNIHALKNSHYKGQNFIPQFWGYQHFSFIMYPDSNTDYFFL